MVQFGNHISEAHSNNFMKQSMAILYVLVSLSLVFSLTALLIVAQNNSAFAPNQPSTTPTPTATKPPATQTPTPTINTHSPIPTPPSSQIAISYNETSRQTINDDNTTEITLTVNVAYENGSAITIHYSDFKLGIYSSTVMGPIDAGTVNPQNTGTFTIGPQHPTENIQLTFQYPTTSFNGRYNVPTQYQLTYIGTATINWTNRSIHE